jgi:alpha-galactosidase
MKITLARIFYTVDKKRKELLFKDKIENEDLIIIPHHSAVQSANRFQMSVIPKRTPLKILDLTLEVDETLNEQNPVFLNGYQTWTDSREFMLSETIPRLNPLVWPIMSMYGDYGFYKGSSKRLHSWSYTYIRRGDTIALIGSLSEASGYTLFEYHKQERKLTIKKDCQGLMINHEYPAFDLFIQEGEENTVFDSYFAQYGRPKPKVSPCTGWTSWYNYYTNISQEIVFDNLNAFASRRIPIDIFQIDDGYQEAVGDWLKIKPKFPQGMKPVAQKIHESGYKAGLWLAPFICEKKSELYRQHPQWVVKKAGWNPGWSGYFYALDIYNPEVRAYLKNVFDTVLNEWNFDMVKLDFLYAAALIERKDKTRGQIMYEAMSFLREIAGNKIILGCGVPLGCSFGLVDYCRIGGDVALKWEDKLLTLLGYRERVSTLNSLRSTIGRRHLNGRAFWNDPDVFILRSTTNQLTPDQRYTLLLLNLIFGGLVFTSDNLNEYTSEELQLFQSIFPQQEKQIHKVVSGKIVEIYFSIGEYDYLTLSNLGKEILSFTLINQNYIKKGGEKIAGGTTIVLKPYESVCLLEQGPQDGQRVTGSNIFML